MTTPQKNAVSQAEFFHTLRRLLPHKVREGLVKAVADEYFTAIPSFLPAYGRNSEFHNGWVHAVSALANLLACSDPYKDC